MKLKVTAWNNNSTNHGFTIPSSLSGTGVNVQENGKCPGFITSFLKSAQMHVLYPHCPVSAAPIPLKYAHPAPSGIWEKSDISHTTDVPISNSEEQKRLPTAGLQSSSGHRALGRKPLTVKRTRNRSLFFD